MSSLIDHQKMISGLDLSGWPSLGVASGSAGSSGYAGSMTDTSPAPASPCHLRKRRRLSRLLDKLAVQIRNNNHYPPPPWLMIDEKPVDEKPVDEKADDKKADDEKPLDLSIKAEQTKQLPTPPVEPAFVCPTCGQTFSVHDRLAKHVASRHRNRTPESARAYECEICRRRFARSDMLTRHARLHSGVKPYACSACGQVFSRSDHLATHQRTHTGEKPYSCPVCPYAACRRDMITRHMRTHTRRPHPA